MRFAIQLAKTAPKKEIPVAAVIAVETNIISYAHNAIESFNKAWYHAEFLAVQSSVGKYLSSASLYVTLEPCIFCAALLEKVKIKNIYFGAYNWNTASLTGNLNKFPYLLKNTTIIGGLYEQECSNILHDFFEEIR